MMLRIACIAAFMAVLLLPDPSRAAQGPDELYAKGRYREAEAAYRKLDLENPTDLRYRYDRGCAAFQAGSLDEAAAAFTSVARRAQKGDLKFRALFNLGSTAYRKGDFAASRDEGKQDLSGELKGRNIGSGSQGGGNPLEMSPAERVERARAEALLNNTRESRARARALHAAPGGPAPVGSGKEW